MSVNNINTDNNGQEKSLPESTVHSVPQNLTTIQSVQNIQSIQNSVVTGSIPTIQTVSQAVTAPTPTIIGKSISLDLNSSKILMKPAITSNIVASDSNKIINTQFVPGSTIKIVSPNVLNTIERQIQSHVVQQGAQTTQQIVTNIPSTYHVPRGPAAVANISTPRSTNATPLVRTMNAGQQIPISRPGNATTCSKPRVTVGITNNTTSRNSDVSAHNNVGDFTKTVTIYKSRVNTTSTTAWQTKASPVVYAQAQRIQGPVSNRSVGRPVTTPVYSNQQQTQQTPTQQIQQQQQPRQQAQPQTQNQSLQQQQVISSTQQQTAITQPQTQTQQQLQVQSRLINPNSIGVVRPMQAVIATAANSTRLIAPVIQAQNANIAKLPLPTRPNTPQVVMNLPQVSQTAGRPITQLQPNQTNRPLANAAINRLAVSTPVIGTSNRIVTTVQTTTGRQLTINTNAGATTNTLGRIVIQQQAPNASKIQIQQQPPQQQQQQQQQQTQLSGGTRVTPLSNFSRVITTTSTNAAVANNVARVAPTGPTSVTRITGMSLHPLPQGLTPGRTVTPLKITSQAPNIQTVQLKPAPPTIQQQPQVSQSQPVQQQPLQPQQLQQQQQQPPPPPVQQSQPLPQSTTSQSQPQMQQQPQLQAGAMLQRVIGASMGNSNVSASPASCVVTQPQTSQVQGQYLHPSPHSTTYYSMDSSGNYSQYRPASMQPVRLLVDQGFEEPPGKPNASPRPSILRKRDVDVTPGKGIAKNLGPILNALPGMTSASSPPGSPKADRDGGNHSSGSTTVSATSSPGLDDEPEQSRLVPMNPILKISPRKKPRKQQLAAAEPRCTVEDMQFITEEIKKVNRENIKDNKYNDRQLNLNQQENKPQQATPVKSKPSLSMIGNTWKNQYAGRLHHYKRPSDVKPREDKKLTLTEIAQQKQILQKLNGWKLHHIKTQLEDLADAEKLAYKTVKATMMDMEPLRGKNDKDDAILDKINELCKGNMQRHNLVSEGLNESTEQLFSVFKHKPHVKNLLQSNCNKRVQKKRDK